MRTFIILFVFIIVGNYCLAQKLHSDNGDGTYSNPVIFADFPDPDVVRVDSVYYMISTTMFVFPGVTILKSYDLVNWEYCSNAVQRMDYSPCYNLDGCDRYGHGQWATSLQYHNGTFYLMFNTLDDGGFVGTATNPEGPWELKKIPRGFYDPGLFFDDDGKIYVAHGYSTLYMTELDSNFTAVDDDVQVYEGDIRPGLEGCRVYKINGYYYIYATYGGGDGFQVALRAENIYGPYEQKVVIRDNGTLGTGLHQGALVETQTGEWWTIIFQDGGPLGRFPTLQPVTWEDDWPMVGVNGEGVDNYPKPDVGKTYPVKTLPTSDEFDSINLGLQWGWNHNPDSTQWSLTENPGHLRLSTVKAVENLPEARNTLTQRIFAYYTDTVSSTGAIHMNVDQMKNGDVAGLTVFQDPYAYIGVKRVNGINYIVMVNDGNMIDSVSTDSSDIYLRAQAHYGTGMASFSYSFDNQSYTLFGNELDMQFNLSVFTGNKFGLFNYATADTGGYVDFDWFRTGTCGQTPARASLQVNGSTWQESTEITVNPGDTVHLATEADGQGTWNWSGCGLSGTDSTRTIIPSNSCSATATFTNSCGVKSMLRYTIHVNQINDVSGTRESVSDLMIIPNPVQSEFQVSWESFYNELTLYRSDGKPVMHIEYDPPQQKAQLSPDLKTGVYFVVVRNNKETAVTSLYKSKTD